MTEKMNDEEMKIIELFNLEEEADAKKNEILQKSLDEETDEMNRTTLVNVILKIKNAPTAF